MAIKLILFSYCPILTQIPVPTKFISAVLKENVAICLTLMLQNKARSFVIGFISELISNKTTENTMSEKTRTFVLCRGAKVLFFQSFLVVKNNTNVVRKILIENILYTMRDKKTANAPV